MGAPWMNEVPWLCALGSSFDAATKVGGTSMDLVSRSRIGSRMISFETLVCTFH